VFSGTRSQKNFGNDEDGSLAVLFSLNHIDTITACTGTYS
jgi:hypothetical protein